MFTFTCTDSQIHAIKINPFNIEMENPCSMKILVREGKEKLDIETKYL